MRSLSLSIRVRIVLGFAFSLSVFVAISAYTLAGKSDSEAVFDKFVQSANATFGISEWYATLGKARLAVEKYSGTPNEETKAAASAALDDLENRTDEIITSVGSDEVASELAETIAASVDGVREALAELEQQNTQIENELASFYDLGTKTQRALVGLTDQAFSGQDYNATYYAAIALQQFAQSRSNIEQYILTGDNASLTLAQTNAKLTRSTFRTSFELRKGAEYAERREIFTDNLKAYTKLLRSLGPLFEAQQEREKQLTRKAWYAGREYCGPADRSCECAADDPRGGEPCANRANTPKRDYDDSRRARSGCDNRHSH